MRILIAASLAAAFALAGLPARAETRIFIIANVADSDKAEACLAAGKTCGDIAAAYCQSKQFTTAVSYWTIGRDEITGAVPAVGFGCGRHGCDEFVAIECTR